MLKFLPILRDRKKLDFLKLRFYNLHNDHFLVQNLMLERLRNHTCMATELVAKYCSLCCHFKQIIDTDITSCFTGSFVSSSRLDIESELVYYLL